eukprot:TRINITY_DN18199_c0_g1_i1.p1 TRINITY_DN18199_c0_g1~~TRINITY_DN18199_c0_g1_i1.p1  ORF type:complete len:990 (+),score=113.17 TRINITY_DN18199_c0_g1_i1:31-2970(+)
MDLKKWLSANGVGGLSNILVYQHRFTTVAQLREAEPAKLQDIIPQLQWYLQLARLLDAWAAKADRLACPSFGDGSPNAIPIQDMPEVRGFTFQQRGCVQQYLPPAERDKYSELVAAAWSRTRSLLQDNALPSSVDPHQIFAVILYTLAGDCVPPYYEWLNESLRTRKFVELLPLVYLTDRCMQALPSWKGTAYRGISFKPNNDKLYRVGNRVVWCQVNSLSVEERVALQFCNGTWNTLFVVEVCRGVDISPFSNIAAEREILLPIAAEFTVLRVERTPNARVHLTVYLRQIPSRWLFPPSLPRSSFTFTSCCDPDPPAGTNEVDCSAVPQLPLSTLLKLSALGPTVLRLDLHGCYEVNDEVLVSCAALVNLEELSIAGCLNVTVAGARHISTYSRLRALCISGCRATREWLEWLAPLPALEDLSATDCPWITGADLSHFLKAQPQMRRLELSRSCQVDDMALVSIAQLTRLTSLRIERLPRITTDALVRVIQQCTGLTELSLAGSPVDAPVLQALGSRSQLLTLDISETTGPERLSVSDLAQLYSLGGLTSLAVRSQPISDTTLAVIANRLRSLQHFDCSFCFDPSAGKGVTAVGAVSFARSNPSLLSLATGPLTAPTWVPDTALPSASGHCGELLQVRPELTYLTPLYPSTTAPLPVLELRTVQFGNTDLPRTAPVLAACMTPHLARLELVRCTSLVFPDTLPPLSSCTRLKIESCTGEPGDSTLHHLISVCCNLREFEAARSPIVDGNSLDTLKNTCSATLSRVQIVDCSVTCEQVTTLVGATKDTLDSLEITATETLLVHSLLLATLQHCGRLSSLSLHGEFAPKDLGDALPRLTNLTALSLRGPSVALAAFLRLHRAMPTVRRLQLTLAAPVRPEELNGFRNLTALSLRVPMRPGHLLGLVSKMAHAGAPARSLRELACWLTKSLSDAQLKELVKHLPNLGRLCVPVEDVSPQVWETVSRQLLLVPQLDWDTNLL